MPACKAQSVADMLKQVTLKLEGGHIESPRLEAEMIISEKSGLSKTELYTYVDRELASSEMETIIETVSERLTGRPIQYVLGRQKFRYLDILCRDGVLIPRPETELLVDAVIDELAIMNRDFILDNVEGLNGNNEIDKCEILCRGFTVVDLCCGTGAIGLSIAHESVGTFVCITDKSSQATSLAKENAKRNNLQERVSIVESDMFGSIGHLEGVIDVLVSNPPYIRRGDLEGLQREIRFEPRMALDGGIDGLDYYRVIAEYAPGFLKSKGILLLEVGYDQCLPVMDLLEKTSLFGDIGSHKDYQGIERIVRARKV